VTLWCKGVKGHARQQAQVAGATQILHTLLLDLAYLALAGHDAPKVRMAWRRIEAQVSGTAADGANVAVVYASA
jgi:hypothetical protein